MGGLCRSGFQWGQTLVGIPTGYRALNTAQPVRDAEQRSKREGVVDHAVIRSRYGVDDGFRIDWDPQAIQGDQGLTSADCCKFEQEIRNSATSRNQKFTSQDDLTEPSASDKEQTS